jgi:alpha-D-xyloside xylohydrolase
LIRPILKVHAVVRVRVGFEEEIKSEWLYTVETTGIGFDLQPGEHYYGLGEQFTAFDRRGQSLDVAVTQPHTTNNTRAYKNVPFYLSTRGYGLLVDTIDRTEFSFGSGADSAVGGEIRVHDDDFGFLFFAGPELDEVLATYTAVSGQPALPPKWSFGLWTSRYSYKTREELDRVTRRFREESIPCDGVHLDISWMRDGNISDLVWDETAFPNPESMIADLHERNFRVMLIEEPYLTVGSDAFSKARREGYLVDDDEGEPYLLDRLVVSKHRGGIVDFTNEAAVEWWQGKHRRLLSIGVDGFWTDFGEYLPDDAILSNGKSGARMRNQYPHRYQSTVWEAMAEAEQKPLLWGRSGWAGTQRFPVHWGGDSEATFASMAATLRGGLSLAVSGYGFWSHDIGGFDGTPSPELYIRWAQFGLLSSHARVHGKTPREPWEFGDEAVSIFRKFARLRYRLLPYLYTVAAETSETGLPVMRPLVLHYHDDPAVRTIETQYLLGRDLLVAPVLEPDGHVEVYLPEGTWIDYWSGRSYEGQQTIERTVPLDEMPLFVRAGSVIPKREPIESINDKPPEHLTLGVRPGEGTASGQYFDEKSGKMTTISVTTGDTLTVTVDGRLPETTVEVMGAELKPSRIVVGNGELSPLSDDRWTFDDGLIVIDCGRAFD